MTNREIARVLERIADMLQVKDDNPFKIRAYRKAAHAVYHLDEDIKIYHAKNRLSEIPGVGKAVQAKIEELIEKGELDYYNRLAKEVPEGLLDMLALPGIGHKTVKTIYDELGIDNLNDLLQAAEARQIRNLPGMGGKTEYNIKKGIELLSQRGGKATLGLALPLAEEFLLYLRDLPLVIKADIVGSIRRGCPLVSDVDILVTADDLSFLSEKVKNFRGIAKISKDAADVISGELAFGINFEIIMVPPTSYAFALAWTTGSKAFRSEVFTNAQQLIDSQSEEEVFARLDMAFIPPELREMKGEIELARRRKLPQLITIADIKGDLHTHSDWSDGAARIQEIADYARKLNYSYIAITDHSKSLPISGGLNEERLSAQGKVIDAINSELSGFRILKGIEADILKDGRLDFDDAVLDRLDVVIASVHSSFKLDKDAQTARIIRAIRHPRVNIIGHLTGRLLNRRSGYEVDIDRILEEASLNKVALEINSHPDRLDIDEDTARKAKQLGVKIAINSDSHHKEDLNMIRYGILNARRGYLEPDDVINTWDLDRLMKFLKE